MSDAAQAVQANPVRRRARPAQLLKAPPKLGHALEARRSEHGMNVLRTQQAALDPTDGGHAIEEVLHG
jgi:hypothetical protein